MESAAGGSPVESLQSHFILTMSYWSSGLPVCFPSQGTRVQTLGGYLCDTGILLLALSIDVHCANSANEKSDSVEGVAMKYATVAAKKIARAEKKRLTFQRHFKQ